MENANYSEFVMALAKPGEDILKEMSPQQMHLLHCAVGISGETGELLDAIKKAAVYQKPIDLENVVEELGDLEFYMEGLRSKLGITREQTIEANIKKLEKRYKGGYSNKAAQERADKAGLIAYGGDCQPVGDEVRVKVVYRNGETVELPADYLDWGWKKRDSAWDIISYEVVE